MVNNWFTALSCTPVSELTTPLFLHKESISSNTIICNPELSPFSFSSSSASENISLIFFSVSPTYLSNNSGPLITLNSLTLRTFARVLAIKVFPVPGGP